MIISHSASRISLGTKRESRVGKWVSNPCKQRCCYIRKFFYPQLGSMLHNTPSSLEAVFTFFLIVKLIRRLCQLFIGLLSNKIPWPREMCRNWNSDAWLWTSITFYIIFFSNKNGKSVPFFWQITLHALLVFCVLRSEWKCSDQCNVSLQYFSSFPSWLFIPSQEKFFVRHWSKKIASFRHG